MAHKADHNLTTVALTEAVKRSTTGNSTVEVTTEAEAFYHFLVTGSASEAPDPDAVA